MNILEVMLPQTAYLIDEIVELSELTLQEVHKELELGILNGQVSKAIIHDLILWWKH